MLELGYALGKLSDKAIIPVMNTHFGPAEVLPADIRDRRWPIGFDLAEGATEEVMLDEKDRLTKRLCVELRQCLQATERRPRIKPTHELHVIPSQGGTIHVNAVNANGEVVGWAYRHDGLHDPYRWSRERGFQVISIPEPFIGGIADNIDGNGRVVGRVTGRPNDREAGTIAFQQESAEAKVELLHDLRDLGSSRLVSHVDGRIGHHVSSWVWSPNEGIGHITPSQNEDCRVRVEGFGNDGLVYGVEITGSRTFARLWDRNLARSSRGGSYHQAPVTSAECSTSPLPASALP